MLSKLHLMIKSCKNFKLVLIALIFLLSCGERSPQSKNIPDSGEQGTRLFNNYICITCHSLDGSEMYGPSLNGLHMKEVVVIRKGKEVQVVADRKYLKRAIMDPDYERVKGFQEKTMPQPEIPEEDLKILLDFLISQ